MSGVKLHPLNSIQDRIMRRYLTYRTQREVYRDKILAYLAISSTNGDQLKSVEEAWKDYLSFSFFTHKENEEREQTMLNEYKSWQNVSLSLTRTKDGTLVVKGAPIK